MDSASFGSRLPAELGLPPGAKLLVGLSGGPDSLALTHWLHSLGFQVVAAHFDHALRPESAADAERVEALAAQLGVAFVTARGDVAAHAGQQKLSTEEAARELRYRFLFQQAEKLGAAAVAVAHTADDQAETVLMHLLRGAGLDGLSGMQARRLPNPWSEAIPLIRPLLDIWRDEVQAYCVKQQLEPLADPSNTDLSFFRNRLRHELLPILADYNPQAKAHLHQSARLLAADNQVLESLAEQAWPRVVGQNGVDFVRINRLALFAEPLALQRRLLRRAHAALRPGARNAADFAAVERALALLSQDHSGPRDWVDGLFMMSEGAAFWIADWEAQLPTPWPQAPETPQHFEAPGTLLLEAGWQLEAEERDEFSDAWENRDAFQAWLDWEASGPELLVRRRQPGDRFQPLGLEQGSIKLADFFINEKLPQRARDAWPLLCRGEHILWVPGFRLAQPYRLRPDSRRALHVQLRRTNGNRVE